MSPRRAGRERLVIATSGILLALPMVGLAVLLADPGADVEWRHHPSHFWLVLGTATASAVLAYSTGMTARRRGDARVLLVSLAFLSAAGFLGLHALATPGVLLATPNPGFELATPVGLLLASVYSAWSSSDLGEEHGRRVVAAGGWLLGVLLVAMALWAFLSLAGLPPLDGSTVPDRAALPFRTMALVAVGLFLVAAVRYVGLWRRRRSLVTLGMAASFVLLAEAMVAVALSRNWHVSWWEWHVLMLLAFVLVMVAVRTQWREEPLVDVYTEETRSGTREISVLFADLQGFTAFAETHAPGEVTTMLNAYFEVALPAVARRHGGEVDRLLGDAVLVTFNRRGDQPDHPRRATTAALDLQERTESVAAEHPGWPRFRAAVNTGDAVVGIVGATGGRTPTVIGDTVNVAARLQGIAPVGGVVIGPATAERLGEHAVLEPLGELTLKGRSTPVEGFLVRSLHIGG